MKVVSFIVVFDGDKFIRSILFIIKFYNFVFDVFGFIVWKVFEIGIGI